MMIALYLTNYLIQRLGQFTWKALGLLLTSITRSAVQIFWERTTSIKFNKMHVATSILKKAWDIIRSATFTTSSKIS